MLTKFYQEEEKKHVPDAMKKYYINVVASDWVSLWRTLPDVRFEEYVLILCVILCFGSVSFIINDFKDAKM